MLSWSEAIGLVADQHGFAGVVSVDRGGEMVFAEAFGFADRAHQLPNTVATRFAIASGTKGLTALTVVSLIDDHALDKISRRVAVTATPPLASQPKWIRTPGGAVPPAADVSTPGSGQMSEFAAREPRCVLMQVPWAAPCDLRK